jgi:hypothetical protein
MSYDAKPLTTADVHKLEHVSDEDGVNFDAVEVDKEDLIATTRALETAQTAVTISNSRDYERIHQQAVALHALADEAVGDRDSARARVVELETVLGRIVCYWDAEDEGKVHPDLIDAARSALAKVKVGAP